MYTVICKATCDMCYFHLSKYIQYKIFANPQIFWSLGHENFLPIGYLNYSLKVASKIVGRSRADSAETDRGSDSPRRDVTVGCHGNGGKEEQAKDSDVAEEQHWEGTESSC